LAIGLGAAPLLYWLNEATVRLSWGLSDYLLLRGIVDYLLLGLLPFLFGLMIGYRSSRAGGLLGALPTVWMQLWTIRRLVWVRHHPDWIAPQLLRPVVFEQLLAGALGGYLGQRLWQAVRALEEEPEETEERET
jgi:hypothetical protein